MFHPAFRAYCAALILLALSSSGVSEAASAKTWRQHRDTARASVKAGDFEQALANYRIALDEAEGWRGTDIRYLDTAIEAARLHIQLRQFKQAIPIYEAALQRMTSAKGDEKVVKGVFMIRLGQAQMYARQLEKAEATFLEARKYLRERFGDNYLLIGHALEGLAAVKVEQKHPEEAIELLHQAMRIVKDPGQVNALGTEYGFDVRENTSSIANIQNTLGIVHASQTNHSEAEKWFLEAVEILDRNRGKTSPELDPVLKNLARSLSAQGKFAEAEDALLRSLLISERMEGGQLSYSQAAYLLGRLYAGPRQTELPKLFDRLLDGSWKSHRPENFLLCLRHMTEAAENWAEAKHLLDQGITAHEAKFGQDNEQLPQILRFAAEKAGAQKLPLEAELYLEKWISSVRKSAGENSIALADPYKVLAEHHTKNQAHEKAEVLYLRQIALMKARFGETDSRVANALDDYAGAVEKAGRAEEAAKIRAEASRVRAASVLGN